MTPEERVAWIGEKSLSLFQADSRSHDFYIRHKPLPSFVDVTIEAVRAAIAEEREACAKIADKWNRSFADSDAFEAAQEIAATIRART